MTEGNIAEVCVRLSSQTAQTLEFNLEVTLTVASGTARKSRGITVTIIVFNCFGCVCDVRSIDL